MLLIEKDDILDEETKNLLVQYCHDHANHHSTLNITFQDVLVGVWEKILQLKDEYQTEVKHIICDEMKRGKGLCFTGRLSRLVSCLQGFIEGVELKISEPDQINNIILMIKKRLEKQGELTTFQWRKEFKEEMEERKFPKHTIDMWIDYIEV